MHKESSIQKEIMYGCSAPFHINYQGNITPDQIDVFQDAITNLKFLRRIFQKEEFLFSIGIILETSLAEYLANKHEYVTELAQDSSTPTSTLEKLATQTSLPIRRQVYHNCNTTYSEIKKLCEKEAAKRLQDKSYTQDSREILSFVLENFYKYNASKDRDKGSMGASSFGRSTFLDQPYSLVSGAKYLCFFQKWMLPVQSRLYEDLITVMLPDMI